MFLLKSHSSFFHEYTRLCILWNSWVGGGIWVWIQTEQPSAGFPWALSHWGTVIMSYWGIVELIFCFYFIKPNHINKGNHSLIAAGPLSEHRTLKNVTSHFNGISDKWQSISIKSLLVNVEKDIVFNIHIAGYLNGLSAKELSLRHSR